MFVIKDFELKYKLLNQFLLKKSYKWTVLNNKII